MKHRRLNIEETKLWVKIYWSLIEKGLSHIEAFTLADNKVYKENKKIWTLKQVEKNLRINVKGYGSAIAVAGLYKKLYGEFPDIGLSAAQAGFADALVKVLPDKGASKIKH